MYMAKLLQAFGYDVGHEGMGEDGISAWSFAPFADKVLSPRVHSPFGRKHYVFDCVIHVVRDPFQVVGSIFHVLSNKRGAVQKIPRWLPIAERYLLMFPDEDIWDKVVRFYIGWNKLVEAAGPDVRVRVEEAVDVLRKKFGREPDQEALPPCDCNTTSKSRVVAIAKLRSVVAPRLFERLVRIAADYGYDRKEMNKRDILEETKCRDVSTKIMLLM